MASKIKRLFWDLETSPNICYSWRTGYRISLDHDNILQERAIICVCYKWQGRAKVRSITWQDGDDRPLLEAFRDVYEQADEMVAHNGDFFDIKWYNARNLIHNLPPLPDAKTVDTLQIAKRKFYLNSNRLDYLAQLLLGEGKIHTTFGL